MSCYCHGDLGDGELRGPRLKDLKMYKESCHRLTERNDILEKRLNTLRAHNVATELDCLQKLNLLDDVVEKLEEQFPDLLKTALRDAMQVCRNTREIVSIQRSELRKMAELHGVEDAVRAIKACETTYQGKQDANWNEVQKFWEAASDLQPSSKGKK